MCDYRYKARMLDSSAALVNFSAQVFLRKSAQDFSTQVVRYFCKFCFHT